MRYLKLLTFVVIIQCCVFSSCTHDDSESMTLFYYPGVVDFQNSYSWLDMKKDCMKNEYNDTIAIGEACYDDFINNIVKSEHNTCENSTFTPNIYIKFDTCEYFVNVENHKCIKSSATQNSTFILNDRAVDLAKLVSGYCFYTESKSDIERLLQQYCSTDIFTHFEEITCYSSQEERPVECVKILVLIKD